MNDMLSLILIALVSICQLACSCILARSAVNVHSLHCQLDASDQIDDLKTYEEDTRPTSDHQHHNPFVPRKVLAVFGATGQQGGAVIRNVLEDPILSGQRTIRAIVRNPMKPLARSF